MTFDKFEILVLLFCWACSLSLTYKLTVRHQQNKAVDAGVADYIEQPCGKSFAFKIE